MGKILDYIVKKGEGNYLCYKTLIPQHYYKYNFLST